MKRFALFSLAGLLGLLLAWAVKPRAVPVGDLVLTQIPAAASPVPGDRADALYPPGSRVVLTQTGADPLKLRVLSEGLSAAGSPVVSPDARRVVFAAKASDDVAWQIYEAPLDGGPRRQLTRLPAGATSPALLPNGDVVFVSPAPGRGGLSANAGAPALFVLPAKGGPPRQLTFGLAGVSDPTVLADGRILFVAAQPGGKEAVRALFTINNDGTEVSAYACQHDGGTSLRRPRELSEGRLGFLAGDAAHAGGQADFVRAARPFNSRARLLPALNVRCRSLEPDGEGNVLAALQLPAGGGRGHSSWAVFRLNSAAVAPGVPLFDDPSWDEVEAVRMALRPKPRGHLSTVDPTRQTGTLLCLDANRAALPSGKQTAPPPARRVRVLTQAEAGGERALGEVPVQADGSFLAEVPADVPLGFEALDGEGRVLRRLPPSVWVRPGENRACVGCHAPHGFAPRNHRPLAAKQPAARLSGESLLSAAPTPPQP